MLMRAPEGVAGAVEDSRPQSPFEVLLAVSGKAQSRQPLKDSLANLSSSPSPPSKQSAYSQDGEAMQQLRDARSAGRGDGKVCTREGASEVRQGQLQESLPEGVGTSGGGESGDTGNSSISSRGQDLEDFDYPKEESSGIRTAPKSSSWGARSPTRSQLGKKQRMMWTSELHERFLNAVNHLGMKNAVPKTILRMMNVDGMTRENVASHLQKYRLYLKRQAGSPHAAASAHLAQTSAAEGAPPASVPLGLPTSSFSQLVTPLSASSLSGTPVLGLPVNTGYPSCFPLSMSYIPPQAWAAGVPGYDALQALRSLNSSQTPPASHAALSTSAAIFEAAGAGYGAPPAAMPTATKLEAPVLDIKPLETLPRTVTPNARASKKALISSGGKIEREHSAPPSSGTFQVEGAYQ